MNIHWKDWCWNWNSNTLATWCKELTHLKRPDTVKDWRQEEKGTTEDEMVGWHHQLNGHKCEYTLGVGDGQGGLACCCPWGHKESDPTERLNWTEELDNSSICIFCGSNCLSIFFLLILDLLLFVSWHGREIFVTCQTLCMKINRDNLWLSLWWMNSFPREYLLLILSR